MAPSDVEEEEDDDDVSWEVGPAEAVAVAVEEEESLCSASSLGRAISTAAETDSVGGKRNM